VNHSQPIGSAAFIKVWLLCSTVHLTFAIIEKSFQQEKLIKGVALIFIKKGDEP